MSSDSSSSGTCAGSTSTESDHSIPELSSYNPLTEWGSHYNRLFQMDLWADHSEFDLIDVQDGVVTERHVSNEEPIDSVLRKDPDLRIFYSNSKVCDDGVTRSSFSVEDLKKIFHKYDFSIVFLDRFLGRNRPTVGSRKRHDPVTNQIISYDLWYDLPCRIYTDSSDYDTHFVLFTVYVHYDCRTKKTVMFYIHRLGSGNSSVALKSSEAVKARTRRALAQSYTDDALRSTLEGSPFAAQIPTITCSVVFWTETLHKERLSMWSKEDAGRTNFEAIDTNWLHNVTRYMHSYKTNISVLLRTLELVKSEHEWFAREIGHTQSYSELGPSYGTVADVIDSQIFQMRTISTFSDEVVERTQTLISIYFSKISVRDSKATAIIAAETRHDAVSMRTIAIVTLIFLPATFVSAFFGMGFFEVGSSVTGLTSKGLWLYPVIAIPLTLVVIGVWWYWQFRRLQASEGSLEEGGKVCIAR